MMLGAKVVYGKGEGIHVSGHGSQEDHKALMIALTRPKLLRSRFTVSTACWWLTPRPPNRWCAPITLLIIDNGDVVETTRFHP